MEEFKKMINDDELFKKIVEKIGEKQIFLHEKKDSVIIDNNGSYIPATKFSELNETKKGLQKQLDNLQTELGELNKTATNTESYKEQIKELGKKMEDQKKTFEETEIAEKKKYALRISFASEAVRYPELIETKIDLSKVELDEHGKLKNGEEIYKPLKETYPDMFGKVVKKGSDLKESTYEIGENGIYSMEQIKAMPSTMLSDPKILEKVNESLSKHNSK
uniref:Putative head-tail joining protein n=1 Tax=viral metagenome TaxID=1070528 RepID=A0A6H1ZU18_9ZZZZ